MVVAKISQAFPLNISSILCELINFHFKLLKYYKKNNLSEQRIISNNKLNKNDVLSSLAEIAMDNYVCRWEYMVSSDTGNTKIGGNKLRTYRMLKTEFKTEAYVKCILSLRGHK